MFIRQRSKIPSSTMSSKSNVPWRPMTRTFEANLQKSNCKIKMTTNNQMRHYSGKLAARPNEQSLIRAASNGLARVSLVLLVALALQQLSYQADHLNWCPTSRGQPFAQAVTVRRLQVPDLVVVAVDQLGQQQRPALAQPSGQSRLGAQLQNGPEAASLTTSGHGQQPADLATAAGQQQVTFECLISFDRKKDRNLIVKWHHDERNEPIYQWIPELNKRSIAPQYRTFIAPILSGGGGGSSGGPEHVANHSHLLSSPAISATPSPLDLTAATAANSSDQVQLLEAGFRLIRPTKELAGRYTCSAISSQNDDSKSKKMIVYTPPKSFRFNASRTDIGAWLINQRDRLIQLTQPTHPSYSAAQMSQLPPAYRMRGLDAPPVMQHHLTTISPQMYSTIDYVNVNQQRARQLQPVVPAASWPPPAPQASTAHAAEQRQPYVMTTNSGSRPRARHGVKLVCDIDQVFPVPEMSIYRVLAKVDGAHPEKLAKLDTKIERDPYTGLFRVQVTSILDEDELQTIRQNYLSAPLLSGTPRQSGGAAPSASELEIRFECLIALTNLELSKYADNKRSIIYRPGQQLADDNFQAGGTNPDRLERTFAFGSSSAGGGQCTRPTVHAALLYLLLLLVSAYKWLR